MKPDRYPGDPPAATVRSVVAVIVAGAVADAEAEAVMRALRPRFGDAAMLVRATQGGDAAALCEHVLGTLRPRMIVACGDDDLVSVAVSACQRAHVELAIVPFGVSSIARALGIPNDRAAACAAIGRGDTRAFDVLAVGGMFVLGRVLMGRFAELEQRMHAPRPLLSRLWSMLGELFGARLRFEVEVDGHLRRVRATSVVVANSGAIGYAGLRWSPGIDAHDGRFDVVIVHASTIFDYVALVWSWVTDRPRPRQLTHLRVHRRLTVRAHRPIAITVDGRHDRTAELTVELAADRLDVIVPEPTVVVTPEPVRASAMVVPAMLAAC
ncbi:MAG TPA: diacylglycerol kinase family protein [Nannocystaceae bacterium]|nr:diacylglycerol kinase family protein [Nannocystaceae bacterium]